MNIAWDSKYDIGIERIDSEHRSFLAPIKECTMRSSGADRARGSRA